MPRIECPMAGCSFYVECNDLDALKAAAISHVNRAHPNLKLKQSDIDKMMKPEKAPRK